MHAKVVTAIAPLFMDALNSSYRPQKNTDRVEKTNFVRLSKKLFTQPFCPPCICLPRGARGFSLGGKILTTENEPLRETLLSSRGELASPPADHRFRNALENMRCNFVDDAIDNDFDTTDKNFQTINDFQPLQTMDSKSKLSGSQHTTPGAADESDVNPVLSHSATPSPAPAKRGTSSSKRSKIDGGNKSVDYLLRIKHQLEMKKQTEQHQQQQQLDRSRMSPTSAKKVTRLQQSTNNASNAMGATREPFAPKSRQPSALTSRTTSPTLICSDMDQPPKLNAVLPHNNLRPQPQHRSIHYFQQQRLPTNNLHEIHELNVDLCKEDKGNVLMRQGKPSPSIVPTSSPALDAVAVRGKPWGGELAERAASAAKQRRVPSNSRREALGTLSLNMVHEVGNQKMAIICDKEKENQATTRKSFSEFAFKGSANNGEHSTVNIRTSTPSPKGARKATMGTWKPAKV